MVDVYIQNNLQCSLYKEIFLPSIKFLCNFDNARNKTTFFPQVLSLFTLSQKASFEQQQQSRGKDFSSLKEPFNTHFIDTCYPETISIYFVYLRYKIFLKVYFPIVTMNICMPRLKSILIISKFDI